MDYHIGLITVSIPEVTDIAIHCRCKNPQIANYKQLINDSWQISLHNGHSLSYSGVSRNSDLGVWRVFVWVFGVFSLGHWFVITIVYPKFGS